LSGSNHYSSNSNSISTISNIKDRSNIDPSSTDNQPSDLLQTPQNSSSVTQQFTEFFSANPKRSISKVAPSLFSTPSSTHTAQRFRTDQSESANMSTPSPADTSFEFDVHSDNPAWAINFQKQFREYDGKFAQYDARLTKMEQLVAENAQLRATLSETQVALEEAQLLIQCLQNGSPSSASSPVAVKSTSPPPPPPPVAPSYANVAKVAAQTNPAPKKRKRPAGGPPPRRAIASLSRLVSPPTGAAPGYQYVYYPANRSRRTIRQVRQVLRSVGLNNSRILDVHFPCDKVTAFLVHVDYVLEFTSVFHKFTKQSPIADFDPFDPEHLKDPKFTDLDQELRVQKAREIANLRFLRAVLHVRPSLRISLARSFLHQEYIVDAQFDSILEEELAHRASSASSPRPSPDSLEDRLVKKKRLAYLGYRLHMDHDAASALANACSPVLGPAKPPASGQVEDMAM
jgi:hypothetical protein